MSERLMRSRRRITDRDRTADDSSLSTSDLAHDGERTDSQAGSRVGEGTFATGEHVVTAASASGAGHTLASVPIMPRAENAAGPAGGPLSPETAAQIEAARGNGTALDTGTRDVMEGAFGTSFTGVHIHADGEADELNGAVGARAFTTGSDIFFRQGTFQPSSSAGRELLAHELTHVVQQRGMSADGPIIVGPAGDSHEQEADAVAARVVSTFTPDTAPRTGAPATGGAVQRRSTSATIQRYQAGERGHGGIEQDALEEAGFSGDMGSGDIGAIYFGNWMRDFSQVNPGPSSSWYKLVINLLNIVSMGEFNRPLDPGQLGGYLPSEHLDNPLGGKTAESSDATAKEKADAEGSLSDEQKEALKRERDPKFQAKIADAARASGLPDYIERGKQHSRDKLEQAIRDGIEGDKRAISMMNMGNALHAIEDYYAHSNFTEVALAMLAKEGNRAAQRVLDEAKKEGDGFDAATAGGKDPLGRGAGIITGTYGDESHSANKVVSIIEQLKSEVLTGALRRAAILGSARLQGKKIGAEGRSLLGSVGKDLGAVAGAVGGGVGGAASGLVHGFETGHGFFGTIGSMASDAYHGMLSEGRRDARAGGEEGEKLGGEAGEAVGTVLGEGLGGAEAVALLAYVQPIVTALEAAVHLELDEKLSKERSRASVIGAPGGAPTHSQLAKDAPEHPVFQTSRALAVHADQVIGTAMQAAWANPDKNAAVASVLPLVDQFVAHPSTNRPMWQPILETALTVHAGR